MGALIVVEVVVPVTGGAARPCERRIMRMFSGAPRQFFNFVLEAEIRAHIWVFKDTNG